MRSEKSRRGADDRKQTMNRRRKRNKKREQRIYCYAIKWQKIKLNIADSEKNTENELKP